MSIFWVSARRAQGAITWPPAILTMVSRQPSVRIKCKICIIYTTTRLYSNGLVSLKRNYADLHPIVPSRSGSRTHAASLCNDHIRKCLTPHRLNNHFFVPVLTASERLSKGRENKGYIKRIKCCGRSQIYYVSAYFIKRRVAGASAVSPAKYAFFTNPPVSAFQDFLSLPVQLILRPEPREYCQYMRLRRPQAPLVQQKHTES